MLHQRLPACLRLCTALNLNNNNKRNAVHDLRQPDVVVQYASVSTGEDLHQSSALLPLTQHPRRSGTYYL